MPNGDCRSIYPDFKLKYSKNLFKPAFSFLKDGSNTTMSFISISSELEFHVVNNFLLCFYITTITTNISMIGSITYDLSWYYLPNGEQDFVRMIIHRSQKIMQIKGLGVFVCSLETFLKVKAFLTYKIYKILTQKPINS